MFGIKKAISYFKKNIHKDKTDIKSSKNSKKNISNKMSMRCGSTSIYMERNIASKYTIEGNKNHDAIKLFDKNNKKILFSRKLHNLALLETEKESEPESKHIIIKAEESANTIAEYAEHGLEFKKGIHKQKQGTVVCGLATNLNLTENALQNSMLTLLNEITKFKDNFIHKPNYEHVSYLIKKIESITSTYKHLYLGNTDIENELVNLQSLLYEYRMILNLENISEMQYYIYNAAQVAIDKLTLLLNSDKPYFNAEDLIYSSLVKIIQQKDRDTKKNMVNDFIEIAEDLKKNDVLPQDLSSMIKLESQYINVFDYMHKYPAIKPKNLNDMDDSMELSQENCDHIFSQQLNAIIYMMEHNREYEIHGDPQNLENQMVKYFKLPENKEIVNQLAQRLNMNDAHIEDKINTIAKQIIDFFDRLKKHGMTSLGGGHFTAIVYSEKDKEFKRLNSAHLINSAEENTTIDVINYLKKVSKNKKHIFTIARNTSDLFIYSLGSDYELYSKWFEIDE